MTSGVDRSEVDGEDAEDARRRRERRALLDQMTREAEEMGLYDDPPPDYRQALKNARRQRNGEASETAERPDH